MTSGEGRELPPTEPSQASELERVLSEARGLRREPTAAEEAGAAGRVLGDFRLLRELGRGGMGSVWEAEQVSLGRKVALKLLAPHLSLSPEAIDRFHREAAAGGRLNHPGIVSVYEVGEIDGSHFIAQELVPGGYTLAHFLEDLRGKDELPEGYYRALAQLFAKVGDALQLAHDAGVIHRDIKPGNILITESDEPKVADFGLAKINDDLVLSRTGELAGTPFYMSPEQAMSKRMGLDHRTDIFSLGATLYEALTLRRPFEGDTSQQVLEQIVMVDPPDPRRLRSKVPWDLSVICQKALEKRREHRYATMSEFAADLRRHLVDEPIVARPPGAVTKAVKCTRRHPVWSVAGSVAALALAAIMVLLFKVINERDRAIEAEVATTRQNYVAYFYAAQAALDQDYDAFQRLMLSCPEEFRGWEWSHLRFIADSSIARLIGHENGIACVAFSPDGTRIVSGAYDDTLRLWATATGEELAVLQGHEGTVGTAVFSPDGSRIASGSADGTLRLWNGFTGEALLTRQAHDSVVACVAFSPDGTQVVSSATRSYDGSEDSTIRLWDTVTGSLLKELPVHQKGVPTVAFDTTGSQVISGSLDGTIHVWDISTDETLALLRHGEPVRVVELSPDGKSILSAGGTTLTLWDVSTGESVASLVGHDDGISCAAFSPDGDRIVSGTCSDELFLWDVFTGERIARMYVHPEEGVASVSFSFDGRRIVSASHDGTVRIWNGRTGAAQATLLGGSDEWYAAAFSPDGSKIASGGSAETLCLWDSTTRDQPVMLAGHRGWVECVAFSPDGSIFASGAGDGTVLLWDGISGDLVAILRSAMTGVFSVAFSPDGGTIVAGDRDGTVHVWDVTTRAELRTLHGHDDWVRCVAFSHDGEQILSLSDDGVLCRWLATTGELLGQINGPVDAYRESQQSVALSPDGRRAVTTQDGGVIVLWDAVTGKELALMEGHEGDVFAVAFSADGSWIASGGEQAMACLWDGESGELLNTVQGDNAWYEVTAVGFSPDSNRVVAVSDEPSIWDPETGHVLLILGEAMLNVECVTFSPDGRRIVAGGVAGGDDDGLCMYVSTLADARPVWAAAERRERVLPLVQRLFEEHLWLDDVLQELRAEGSLDEDLRRTALLLARALGDPSAHELNDQSRAIVKRADASQDEYAHGLRVARAACELKPKNPELLQTLGIAQYRTGHFDEAAETLHRAEVLSRQSGSRRYTQATSLVFIAMSRQRLGRAEEARRLLSEVRVLSQYDASWSRRGFLTEAEALIGGTPVP